MQKNVSKLYVLINSTVSVPYFGFSYHKSLGNSWQYQAAKIDHVESVFLSQTDINYFDRTVNMWRQDIVVIATAPLHSSKPELFRFKSCLRRVKSLRWEESLSTMASALCQAVVRAHLEHMQCISECSCPLLHFISAKVTDQNITKHLFVVVILLK